MKKLYLFSLLMIHMTPLCVGMRLTTNKCKYLKKFFETLVLNFKTSPCKPFQNNSTQEVVRILFKKDTIIIKAALVITHFNTQQETIKYYEIEDFNKVEDNLYLYHWIYDSIKHNMTTQNFIKNLKEKGEKEALSYKGYTDPKDLFDYASYTNFVNKSNTQALHKYITSFRQEVFKYYSSK